MNTPFNILLFVFRLEAVVEECTGHIYGGADEHRRTVTIGKFVGETNQMSKIAVSIDLQLVA